MKTITEFPGFLLRKAKVAWDEAADDSEKEGAVAAASGYSDERLARLLETLDFLKKTDGIRQVRVCTLDPEETAPKHAKQVGDFYLVIDRVTPPADAAKLRSGKRGGGQRAGDKGKGNKGKGKGQGKGKRPNKQGQGQRPRSDAPGGSRGKRSGERGPRGPRGSGGGKGGATPSSGEGWSLTRADGRPAREPSKRNSRKPNDRGKGKGRGKGGDKKPKRSSAAPEVQVDVLMATRREPDDKPKRKRKRKRKKKVETPAAEAVPKQVKPAASGASSPGVLRRFASDSGEPSAGDQATPSTNRDSEES